MALKHAVSRFLTALRHSNAALRSSRKSADFLRPRPNGCTEVRMKCSYLSRLYRWVNYKAVRTLKNNCKRDPYERIPKQSISHKIIKNNFFSINEQYSIMTRQETFMIMKFGNLWFTSIVNFTTFAASVLANCKKLLRLL